MPMKTGTTKARSFKELYEKLNYKNEFGIEYSKSKEVHEKIMKALQKQYVIKQIGSMWYAVKINTKEFPCTNGEYIHTDDYIIVNQAGSSKKYKFTNIDDCVLGHLPNVKTRTQLSDAVFKNLKFYQQWGKLIEEYSDYMHAFTFLELKICQILDEILNRAAARSIRNGKIHELYEFYVDEQRRRYGIGSFKKAQERARIELGINGYSIDFSLMAKHNDPRLKEYSVLVNKYITEDFGEEINIVRREIRACSEYKLKSDYEKNERIIMTYYYEVLRESLKVSVDSAIVDHKDYEKLSHYGKKTHILEDEKEICLEILDKYILYSNGENEYYRIGDLPEYKEILDNTMDKYWRLDFKKYFYMTEKRLDVDLINLQK